MVLGDLPHFSGFIALGLFNRLHQHKVSDHIEGLDGVIPAFEIALDLVELAFVWPHSPKLADCGLGDGPHPWSRCPWNLQN